MTDGVTTVDRAHTAHSLAARDRDLDEAWKRVEEAMQGRDPLRSVDDRWVALLDAPASPPASPSA